MSSPLPFVPFGTPPKLSPDQLHLLTLAIMAAIRESVLNIGLAEVGSVALDAVFGIVKGKFGILAEIPGVIVAIYNQDWEGVLGKIYDRLANLTGVDDLIQIAEAIKAIDNGRAAVALLKNISYKAALHKLD